MSRKPERSLTPRQRRAVARLAIGVVTLIGMAFVLFFPLRTILEQRRSASEISSELTGLRAENSKLEDAATRLKTDAEIERLARARFHLIRPGETAYVAIEAPPGTPPVTYAPTTTTTRPPAPATTAKPATTTTKPGTATTKPGTATTKPKTATTTTKPKPTTTPAR
jgi:cell division protein FtsB